MILSKSDLQRYLELDRRALGIRRAKRPPLTGYRVWKFQVALRKHEYYANTGRSLFGRIMKKFWGAVHEIYGVRLGFSIPINVFGPGLRINHYGLIVVNPKARVGAFCDIHQEMCIRDRRAGDRSAPGTQFGLRSRCEPGPDSRVGITESMDVRVIRDG